MRKDIYEKIKKEQCEKCNEKDKCEGISTTLDAKAKCISKNIIE